MSDFLPLFGGAPPRQADPPPALLTKPRRAREASPVASPPPPPVPPAPVVAGPVPMLVAEAEALRAWLQRVIRGEAMVPVEGNGRFPYRAVDPRKRSDPVLGPYLEQHMADIERTLAGEPAPHWLMTRWREQPESRNRCKTA